MYHLQQPRRGWGVRVVAERWEERADLPALQPVHRMGYPCRSRPAEVGIGMDLQGFDIHPNLAIGWLLLALFFVPIMFWAIMMQIQTGNVENLGVMTCVFIGLFAVIMWIYSKQLEKEGVIWPIIPTSALTTPAPVTSLSRRVVRQTNRSANATIWLLLMGGVWQLYSYLLWGWVWCLDSFGTDLWG